MSLLDAPPKLGSDLASNHGTRVRDLEQRASEVERIPAGEAKPHGKAAEKLVEGDVAREHRDAGGRGLVDDLVERLAPLGLRRAEQHVSIGQCRKHLLPRKGGLEGDALAENRPR